MANKYSSSSLLGGDSGREEGVSQGHEQEPLDLLPEEKVKVKSKH